MSTHGTQSLEQLGRGWLARAARIRSTVQAHGGAGQRVLRPDSSPAGVETCFQPEARRTGAFTAVYTVPVPPSPVTCEAGHWEVIVSLFTELVARLWRNFCTHSLGSAPAEVISLLPNV